MTLVRGAIVLVLAAPACGPAPQPARPEPAPGQVKQYQPLAMRDDARRTDQAVILGSDDAHGSTVLALPVGQRFVVVTAVASRSDTAELQSIVLGSAPRVPDVPGGPDGTAGRDATGGGDAPSGGDGRDAHGGLDVHGDAGGTGARWRADAWSAALVAATALGKDLGDLTLEVTPAGSIDTTASALLAGGLVALITGDAIDPAATLFGAIQPDGTIGPVAGLAEQATAALARGKTRIGYPAGMQVVRSAAGKDVDLVQLAQARHAEAVEVASVQDAARLLTGRRVPVRVPVPAAAMALDPAARERLEGWYLEWQRRLADEWAPLLQLEQAGRMPAIVTSLLREAHERSARAEAGHRAGQLPAAHGDMLAAWAYATAANRTHAILGKLAAGDLDGAEAALAALDPGDAGLTEGFTRIVATPPTTIAGHLAMIAALEAALRGWAFHELAADSLRQATQVLVELRGKPRSELGGPVVADAVAAAVAPTTLRLLRTVAESAIAEHELALAPGPDQGAASRCAPAVIARAAASYHAAATAEIDRIEALLVEPLARKAGIPVDAARRQVAALEPDYLLAAQLVRSATDGVPHELAASWGDDAIAGALLALAAAQTAHRSAALVLAKYESLGVRTGGGRIEAVNHPAAFRAVLAGADRAARAAGHAAQVATGAIPVQARRAYQLAALEAAGGVDDQIDALAELWTATAIAETAVTLARDCN